MILSRGEWLKAGSMASEAKVIFRKILLHLLGITKQEVLEVGNILYVSESMDSVSPLHGCRYAYLRPYNL